MLSPQEEKKHELEESYSVIDDRLRMAIDAEYGITRTKTIDKAYPTGVVVVRNAKNAKEIADVTIDQNLIARNNMLLRCLGRLRGIDHALKKMVDNREYSDEQKKALAGLQIKLRQDFVTLEKDSASLLREDKTPTARERILQMEKNFNTLTLCDVLHQANLDEGCLSSKDHEALLFHYRNLSSLIDPMPSLVTVTYDKNNQVLHRITQDPITRKLPQQKHAIRKRMSEVVLFPTGEEMTFQTSQNMAMQVANRYFAGLAAMDDRMLGAQTRKTHLYGIKNAFWVTNELVFDVTEQEVKDDPLIKENHEIKTQSFARGAMPVYVGKGETDAAIQQSMRDNMEQVRAFIMTRLLAEHAKLPEKPAAKEATELAEIVKIHYTCLITDSPMEKQSFALGHIKRATRENKSSSVDYSYVPCNWDGTHRRLDLSSMVDAKASPSVHPVPSNQAKRYRQAVQVSMVVREKKLEKVFEFVGCMSGQDRTETASEYASEQWARRCYQEKELDLSKDLDKGDVVEATRAKGRNSADINAHVVGGAPGCKQDSRGKARLISYDDLYAPATNSAMYLTSAAMNKKNPVAEKKLQEIMTKPAFFADIQYKAALEKLTAVCARLRADDPMKKAGLAVSAEVTAAKNRVDSHDIGTLTRILQVAKHVVQGPKSDVRVYSKHVARLGAIAKKLHQKSGWKRLGGLLLALGGVALVAAGVLFAVPSGGSSLLLTVLGAQSVVAAKLSLAAAVSVGGGLVFAGAAGTYFGGKIAAAQTRHGLEKEHALVASLGGLQREGKKVSYVTVHFPPAFFGEYCSLYEKEDVRRQMEAHAAPIVMTDAEIKKSFTDKEQRSAILLDLPRLSWVQQGQSVRLEGETLEGYQAALIRKMPELKLTTEEASAILAVATTMQGKRTQGGAINAGTLLLSTGLLNKFPGLHVGNSLSHFAVRRQHDGSLIIRSTWKPPKAQLISDAAEKKLLNPLQYSETYTLKKTEPGWQLTLLPHNDLQVHPAVWREMLEQACGQLNKANQLTKEQLFSYVPLLSDKNFAEVFASKIYHDPRFISAEQLLPLEQLILKCHGPHQQQPEHILRVRYELEKIKETVKPRHLPG